MSTLVSSFQIGQHAVDVVETAERGRRWYRVAVDGAVLGLRLSAPPDRDEAAELMLLPAAEEG